MRDDQEEKGGVGWEMKGTTGYGEEKV